jgi:hypothetical protein
MKTNRTSSEFQFGFYVGEYIVHRFLPTLDIYCQGATTQVIKVNDEDRIEYERLEGLYAEKIWGNMTNESYASEFLASRKFGQSLQEKYMPAELICYLQPLTIANIDEFKKGLRDSIWNSDVSCYDSQPENVTIYDEIGTKGHVFFTIIKFNLIKYDYE